MSNPALNNMPAFSDKTLSAKELEKLYNQPAANQAAVTAQPEVRPSAADVVGGSADPMTIENTIQKTLALFGVLLVGAAIGWNFPALSIPAALIGLVLSIVIVAKKKISVPLIVAYAAIEGIFVGGISGMFDAQYAGIVMQAVLGTLLVFGVTFALFQSGKVRTSPKMNRIFMIFGVSYLVFCLVNLGLMMFGVLDDPWGLRGISIFGIPLGAVIGVLAVFMASYSLVQDFEVVTNGVRNRLPKEYGWMAGFGLIVTLVWLYVEILRLLAIMRGND